MGIPVHIVETALLLLASYLLGCVIGFTLRRLSRWRPRPAFQAAATDPVPAPVEPRPAAPAPAPPPVARPVVTLRRPSAAARLAMSASDDLPTPVTPAPLPADDRPIGLAAPRSAGADDLQRIKGIGPKIEERLNGWGLYHFDQLAALTPANAAWIDRQLGFKGRVARENWIAQAGALALS